MNVEDGNRRHQLSKTVSRNQQTQITKRQQTLEKSNVSDLRVALHRCSVQDNPSGRGDGNSSQLRFKSTQRRSSLGSSVSSSSGRSSLSLTSSSSRLSGQSSSSSISTFSARKRNQSQDIKEKLSLDIQKKIGNRQLKTVNENSKKCAACSKVLTDDGFFAMGKLYHKTCFRCKYCSVKLNQIFFVRDDSPVCSKCHKEKVETCWVCKQKIVDDHITCNKKFYHPGCMKCYICQEIIRTRFLTFKDQPICERDFKTIGHVCSKCESIITGEVYVVGDSYYCEKDFESLGTGSCSKCKTVVNPDDAVNVGDLVFHHGCLTCVICGDNMEGRQVTLDSENKIYCSSDYERHFCTKCAVCKKPITALKGETKIKKLRAMGKEYHLHCFKCEDCSLILKPGTPGKECWPIKNHLLCRRCNIKRQDESERESD